MENGLGVSPLQVPMQVSTARWLTELSMYKLTPHYEPKCKHNVAITAAPEALLECAVTGPSSPKWPAPVLAANPLPDGTALGDRTGPAPDV